MTSPTVSVLGLGLRRVGEVPAAPTSDHLTAFRRDDRARPRILGYPLRADAPSRRPPDPARGAD
jgi:hypothetical protein